MYQRIHLWMDSLFNFNSIIINEFIFNNILIEKNMAEPSGAIIFLIQAYFLIILLTVPQKTLSNS